MRILHLASGREWRGGQRQTWLLARELSGVEGIEQVVVTARGSELARRLLQDSVPVREVSWRIGVDPRAGLVAWQAARNADLLHAHDAHAVAIAAAVSRITGKPFVATRRMARLLKASKPWQQAVKVIAISDAVRASLVQSRIDSARIEVIPPAIDVSSTSETDPESWERLPRIPPDAPIAVAISALTAEKGIDILIEAAAQLHDRCPRLHWIIAGAGPEREALAALAGALESDPYVHFLGYLGDPLPVIAGATVLVVPSREEGFGSVILDGLALGTPVVATAVGGIPDALARGGGMLVPAHDPVALAQAVERLVNDPNRRRQLSAQGREAAQSFDLGPMVKRVAALYRSVKGVD